MRRPRNDRVVLWFRAGGHVPAVMVGQLLLKELEMPLARSSATLFAIVLWMASCLAAGVSAPCLPGDCSSAAAERDGVADRTQARAGADATRWDWRHSIAAALASARALFSAGYERAPVLVIALCAFIVLPAGALISLLVQRVLGRRTWRAAIRAAPLRAWDAEPTGEVPAAGEIPWWSD